MEELRCSVAVALVLVLLGCGNSGENNGTSPPPPEGSGPHGVPAVPGQPDGSVETALPPLPRLPGVTAGVVGDSVNITVVPVEGARDYRVYVLPKDDDI